MYSYENYAVSEATKRVYRAEAVERIYDNLMNACENFTTEINSYEERLREKQENEQENFVRVDCYEHREVLINQAKLDAFKTVAKELLKL